LFGAVVGRALDQWWADAGSPDPFVVIEAGAGRGALAQAVLVAEPACAPALRYVLVERSAALRERQAEHLTLVPPAFAFEPTVETPGDEPEPLQRGVGPVVVSLAELPSVGGPVVVLANELLDNLPFRVLVRSSGGWDELRVGLRDDAPVEHLVPAGERLAAAAERLAPDADPGARIPLQDAAAGWLRQALDVAGAGGRVVAIDYAATTPELAGRPPSGWLRTYVGQQRGADPLSRLGAQDITADVCIDQLARVAPPAADRSQADFLRAQGIEELVEEGRRTWNERAAVGDLAALKARSRVVEAEALLDPGGLGAFRVLEWLC
jgi:SAM-dependent MidA family methyltransferase